MARSVFPAESVLSLTISHFAFAPLKGKHLAYVCGRSFSTKWVIDVVCSMLIDIQRAQFSMFFVPQEVCGINMLPLWRSLKFRLLVRGRLEVGSVPCTQKYVLTQ